MPIQFPLLKKTGAIEKHRALDSPFPITSAAFVRGRLSPVAITNYSRLYFFGRDSGGTNPDKR